MNNQFKPVGIKPRKGRHADGRVTLASLIRPVLEDPTWILQKSDSVNFRRAILGPMGTCVGYATVSIGDDDRIYVWASDDPGIDALLGLSGDLIADAQSEGEALFKSLWLSGCLTDNRTTTFADTPVVQTAIVTDFDLAAALMGWEGDFFKSDHGPIPAGARWITVHPNGSGTKGTPVLVVPADDGSGPICV